MIVAFQSQKWGKEHCVLWASTPGPKPSDQNHFLKQAICQLAVFFSGKVHKGKGQLREGRKYLAILRLEVFEECGQSGRPPVTRQEG